jgi:hypothetical protein
MADGLMAASNRSSTSKATSPHGHHTNHSGLDVAIELGEHAHHAVESVHKFLERGNSGLKFVSGVRAYKEYSWIRNAPIKTLNQFGGVKRAVIVSRGWKFVHDITILNAEKLEQLGDYLTVAGVAISLAKSHNKFGEIYSSNESSSIKAQRYLALGSMAVFNAIGAPIVPLTHLVTNAIVKACGIAHAPNSSLSVNARAADMAVSSSYAQLMDSDNVVRYINTHLVIK